MTVLDLVLMEDWMRPWMKFYLHYTPVRGAEKLHIHLFLQKNYSLNKIDNNIYTVPAPEGKRDSWICFAYAVCMKKLRLE